MAGGRDAGTSGAGAMPQRSTQTMGQQKINRQIKIRFDLEFGDCVLGVGRVGEGCVRVCVGGGGEGVAGLKGALFSRFFCFFWGGGEGVIHQTDTNT